MVGEVLEALPSATFKVTTGAKEYHCHLSGRMRINHIRILVGDKVEFTPSPDDRLGRITKRL